MTMKKLEQHAASIAASMQFAAICLFCIYVLQLAGKLAWWGSCPESPSQSTEPATSEPSEEKGYYDAKE